MPDRAGAWRRIRSLFTPDVVAEVDEEIAFHLEMRSRDLAAADRGEPAGERAAAANLFGDVRAIRDECIGIDRRRQRRRNRRQTVGGLMKDISYAIRGLRKSPAFTAMAVTCVALGVCVTTTIFSAVNSILLRPLPFPAAGDLVSIYARWRDRGETGVNVSYPDYESWRDENHAFRDVGLYTWSSSTLSGTGDAEQVNGASVTAGVLRALGVAPLLGRIIRPEEEVAANSHVVVLGNGLWQRRFGGDSAIVGKAITIDAEPWTVIGVMPPGFAFPSNEQLWVPLVEQEWMRSRANRGLAGAVARLKPGVTLAAAQADLDAISARLERDFPKDNRGWDAQAITMRDDVVGTMRKPLLVFQAAVALVLLVGCANVANLMLARGTTRHRDIAVRLALGADHRRIAGQQLAEALAIAVAGGAAGTALAAIGVRILRSSLPGQLPVWMTVDLDPAAVAFAAGVAILTGVAVGLVPAFRATRVDPNHWLTQGARGESAGGRHGSRLRSALVVGEVALSLMLLVGATLLVRSYRTLTDTRLGFDTQGIMSARVGLPSATYAGMDRRRATWEQLYDRLAALPGVEAVGSANGIPFSGWNVKAGFSIEGRPAPRQGEELDVHYQNVSPGYFPALGVPLVRGRMFTAADRDTSAHIAVINQAFSEQEFRGQDPVGKRVKFGGIGSTDPWITIIGVVGTFRHYALPQPMGPAIYFPQLASPSFTQTVVVRTSLADPAAVMPAFRRVLHDLDPDVPAYEVQSLHQAVAASLWRQRFQGQVLGIFAVLGVVLALVGIYGVISYMVVLRTREMGVRMALGARRGHVVRDVMGQGLRLAAIGTVLGVAGALALSGLIKGLLYGIAPTDPATYLTVPALLIAAAALASGVPAWRATRVNPLEAIRAE